MKPVYIYYTTIKDRLPDSRYNAYLKLLPPAIKNRNLMYRRWQDRHAHLLGKLLFCEACNKLGFKENMLFQLDYNMYLRPFLNSSIDFNISHSGKFVMCAIAKNVQLGLDVEEINEVDFSDFQPTMNLNQWKSIANCAFPKEMFFRYWTIKESMIKADGRGMHIALDKIGIKGNQVKYEKKKWYFVELHLDKNYCCCLATNTPDIEVKLISLDFYKESYPTHRCDNNFTIQIERK